MQRNILRALLLAMVALMLGAATVTAQSEEPTASAEPGDGALEVFEETIVFDEDGSVLVGIKNDVSLPAGQDANAVVIVQGSALIEGSTRAIVAIDADVTITGAAADVGGILSFGGSLTVSDGASIDDIGYVDTDVTGVDTALISGEINNIETNVASFLVWVVAWIAILLFFVWIGLFIATLASGLFLVAFGTSQARRAAWTIGNDPLKVLAVGLLAAIGPWAIFALLALTIVGLPLAIGLMMMWGFVVFLGYLTVGLWIGERILRRSRTANRPYGAIFLGVLILLLLSWIPFVSAIAAWVGLGAVTLSGWRVLRGGGAPPVPPGYGAGYGQPYQVPPPPYVPPPYAPPPPQYPPQQPPAGWGQGGGYQ